MTTPAPTNNTDSSDGDSDGASNWTHLFRRDFPSYIQQIPKLQHLPHGKNASIKPSNRDRIQSFACSEPFVSPVA